MPKWMHRVYTAIMPKPEDGAKTSIYLSSSPEVATVTGEYFANCKITSAVEVAHDQAIAVRLWDVSAKMVNLEQSQPTLA
jgi:hypothetical protein